ncbi:PorV/PorQ family protein [candidate division WOR-3 bacterium]|nr:PorV/PorQ family protein [candidate division WOR-3 bacterium]
MKKISIIIVLILTVNVPYLFGVQLGGAGASFLTIGGGARPVALGGAYSAIGEGIQSIYWNPAGVANLRTMSINLTHTRAFAGTSLENLATVFPVAGGAVGIGIEAFLSGDIEETTAEEPEGTGYTFSCNDYVLGITYARMMTDKFSLGITVKGINQNLAEVSAFGLAFDIGGVYNTGVYNIRFGFVMRNFGPDMHYTGDALIVDLENEERDRGERATVISQPYSLPMTFQGGFAADIYSSPGSRITLSGDIIHLSDQSATFGVGLEYSLFDSYFLRAGYTEKNSRGFTVGAGFRLAQATLDYCYEDHKYMAGELHRVSLSFGM